MLVICLVLESILIDTVPLFGGLQYYSVLCLILAWHSDPDCKERELSPEQGNQHPYAAPSSAERGAEPAAPQALALFFFCCRTTLIFIVLPFSFLRASVHNTSHSCLALIEHIPRPFDDASTAHSTELSNHLLPSPRRPRAAPSNMPSCTPILSLQRLRLCLAFPFSSTISLFLLCPDAHCQGH